MNDRRFTGAAILTILIALAELGILLFYRETWFDELLYAQKGLRIMDGTYLPFADIALEHPPLAFFFHGAVQLFAGPSIFASRILSALAHLANLALLYRLGSRFGGKWAGLGAAALIVSSIPLAAEYSAGTLFSVAVFWMLLGFLFEFEARGRYASVGAGVAFAAMLMSRINMLPVVIVYGAYLLFVRRDIRYALAWLISFIATVAVIYLPFLRYDPSLALAYLVYPFTAMGPLAAIPASGKVGGAPLSEFLGIFALVVVRYGTLIVLFTAAVASLFAGAGKRLRERFGEERELILIVVSAILMFMAHFGYPRILAHESYAAYVMPLVALATAAAIARAGEARRPLAIAAAAVIAVNLLGGVNPAEFVSSPAEETDLERVARGGALVASHTVPDDTIVAFDNSIFHVFAADRTTYPPLYNRDFFFYAGAERDLVERIHYYNYDMLRSWVADDASVVLVQEETWRRMFYRPFWRSGGDEDPAKAVGEIEGLLKDRYELITTGYNVYPRKYTEDRDGGTLRIYRRRE